MNTVERIKSICKERKIPISTLEKECKFSNGYIGQLRKGTFPNDRLSIISNYLDISIDYFILGDEYNIEVEKADADFAFIKMEPRLKDYALKFAKLDPEDRDFIMSMIDRLEK